MKLKCKRAQERTEITRSVYLRDENSNSGFGYTLNISENGICMISRKPLRTGDYVHLCCNTMWQDPITAKVVWTKNIDTRNMAAGLSVCQDAYA